MTPYKCEKILTLNGVETDMFVDLSPDGTILAVSKAPMPGATTLSGLVIPGFQNAHSHSFQYAMAGLAEYLPGNAASDDFWSWRDAMYNLAAKISPDQFEAVATMLYSEMLRNGITHVVEFHYLHNDTHGKAYPDPTELALRLINAAVTTGIELTLIPIYYRQGGFGKPLESRQQRFAATSTESYLKFVEKIGKSCAKTLDSICGHGVHSLRAVSQSDLNIIINNSVSGPFHLHIAEQQKEVDDCLNHYKKRPVEWLLANYKVDRRYSLVHATHMTTEETQHLAKTGANVVICPSTEGNLGDGFFNLNQYRAAHGQYSIGTDSHIGLSPLEELRWLDYAQRLRLQKRNVICDKPGQDSAITLIRETWSGGRQARGISDGAFFKIGTPFDCVVVDCQHPALYAKPDDRLCGALIYGADVTAFKQVIRRGKPLVISGRHTRYEAIVTNYQKAMKALMT